MKGLLVELLKPAYGDCSNGGASSKFQRFVLTGSGMPEIFEPSADAPELRLIPWYGHFKAVPAEAPPKGWVGPMFGGCHVYSSDSRFSEVCGDHPVKLHDRYESPELYAAMSD